MADEIKLKAPTVEQQVVVNINGEEKLRSFADTLEKISNNKNLQKYWKTQQELINATADAYGNFSKKASQDNAKELIKVTNALKAMSGTDLSNILPDFDKISKAMTEAQKVAGNIDSAFSVKGFKEAFDSFETLRAYGVDIQNLFSHFGVSSDVGELQKNVRALEYEVEKLTRRLTNAKNANEELRNEFENFKTGSGFVDKLDELDNLKSEMSYLREQAEETFKQFLKLNNITEDGYDRDGFYNDNRFKEYFQKIQSGYLSASDAIQQFKREYSYLLDDSFKSNNDTFGLEQLQAFSNKLDSIFRQVEETSTKINDIISNGVITKSVENLSVDSSLSDSQRSLFGNLLKDEESLKSITALFQKLIEESNKTQKVDLFNDEQLQQVLSIFDNMEKHLSSLRSIISDVGDGEEFSPLLNALNDIKEAASNIKLNFNMDLGDEVSERLNQKVSQASARQLEAYRKLFSAMKGTGKTNKEMLKFFEPDEASVTELIGTYKGIIERAEKQFKVGNSNIYKKYLGAEYDALKREITNANKQLSRADSKRSENGILGDLFGNTKDLSGVIEQLNKIIKKLDEISKSALEFKSTFKEGFNVTASVEEIDKLTNRVKELEDELSKVKLNPVNVDKSNISSENSDQIITIKEQEKKTSDIVKLVDNYGRELDEVNSKLLEGTALLDKQGKLIRLYHGSDAEFDKFDLSLSNNESNQIYGKGAYLIENERGASNYGNVVTQWYANVRAVMDEEQKLTLEEAKKLYDEFGTEFLSIATGKPMDFDEFFESYLDFNPEETTVIEKMKDLAGFLGKDVGEIMGTIGYDAFRMQRDNGNFYTIFDPERIIRFKEETAKATDTVEEFNQAQKESSKNITTPPIEDVIQGETEKSGMDAITSATDEAVQAKKDFATANEGVQSSIDDSKSPLQLEADLMNQIAKSAREAADAKKEFVEANKQVKDSADSSNGSTKKEKYKDKPKVSEEDYSDSYFASIANKKLSDNGFTILGESVNTELVDGLVKVNAKIKTTEGTWKTFSAKIDADGNMFEQRFRTITKGVDKLETELENFGRETSPALTYQETLDKANEIRDQLQLGGEYSIKVDSNELVTITKKLSDVNSTATSVTQTFKSAEDAIQNFGKSASNSAEKTSVSLKGVKEANKATSDAKAADSTKLEEQKRIYKELNYLLDRYAVVSKRIASGNALSGDIEEAEKLENKISSLQKMDILSSKQVADSEQMLVRLYDKLDDIERKAQKSTIESWNSIIKSYDNKVPTKPVDKSKEFQAAIQDYKNLILEAQTFISNLGDTPITKDIETQWDVLIGKIKEAKEKVDSFSAAQKGSNEASRWKEIKKIGEYLEDNTRISKQAKDELEGYLRLLKSGDPSVNVQEIDTAFKRVIEEERLAGREGKSFLDIIKDKTWFRWAAQISSYFGLQDIIRYFKDGAAAVQEFDDSLTKISYTMDLSKKGLNDLGSSVLDMASDLRTSIDSASSVAQIYANMQTSAEEIRDLSQPTLIMSNLTGFDAETMANDIQAVTQQFELAADESMHVADVYDYISRNIAVDYSKGIEGMAEAVQVAGSTAKQAGLEFEQLTAIVAKAQEKTRLEGSQIGNGIKTIMTRLSKVGELSDDVDNETLSQASESLHQIGIEVYNLDGSYRKFDVIMGELAGKWNSLSDAEKANISFAIAA